MDWTGIATFSLGDVVQGGRETMNDHPNQHIRAAVGYAIEHGWILRRAGARAHAWGRLYCPRHDREGCQQAVYCTPRVPESHARDIRRAVDNCPHEPDEGQE